MELDVRDGVPWTRNGNPNWGRPVLFGDEFFTSIASLPFYNPTTKRCIHKALTTGRPVDGKLVRYATLEEAKLERRRFIGREHCKKNKVSIPVMVDGVNYESIAAYIRESGKKESAVRKMIESGEVKRLGPERQHCRPVGYNGVTYPSIAEFMDDTGFSRATANNWLRNGDLVYSDGSVGDYGPSGRMKPIVADGVVYPSITAYARFCQTTKTQVYRRLYKGYVRFATVDEALSGLVIEDPKKSGEELDERNRGNCLRVSVDGVEYPSITKCAEALGVDSGTIRRKVGNGEIEVIGEGEHRGKRAVVYDEVEYESMTDFLEKSGFAKSSAYTWLRTGKLFYVDKGLPRNYHTSSKHVVYQDQIFTSMTAYAQFRDVCLSTARGHLVSGEARLATPEEKMSGVCNPETFKAPEPAELEQEEEFKFEAVVWSDGSVSVRGIEDGKFVMEKKIISDVPEEVAEACYWK